MKKDAQGKPLHFIPAQERQMSSFFIHNS